MFALYNRVAAGHTAFGECAVPYTKQPHGMIDRLQSNALISCNRLQVTAIERKQQKTVP